MTVTFHNVTITIESESARKAYSVLCDLLDQYNVTHAYGIEWASDMYTVDGGDARCTSELWPE